jgi:hypothetical protein
MGIPRWRQQWELIRRTLIGRGATGRWRDGDDKPPTFEVDPPATEDEVRAVETELGQPVPQSLRRVIRQFSARVLIEWSLPEEVRPPDVFRQIWAGECRWDLKSFPALHKTHRDWIEHCFTAKSTPRWPDKDSDKRAIEYDLVWHYKFAFLEVGNGDMVGIDIGHAADQPVVYLSHEDGPCHGYRLGNDFEDYVDRLTALAFVGAEDVQLPLFLPNAAQGLQTASKKAIEWQRWLGLAARDV